MECFAFGVGIVRFASLETSFHAANHTIPPPPSHEGYPFCPKDKNRSPFHGEKPLMIDIQYNTALWADVKYHVPTGIGFSPKASGFYPFGDATDLVRGRRW